MRIGSSIRNAMFASCFACMLVCTDSVCSAGPQVGAPTYADWRVDELDSWIEALPLPGPDQEDAHLVHDTIQTLSLIATSLLIRGDRGGGSSSSATVAGALLADGMPELRASLLRLEDGQISLNDRTAARHALRLFVRESRMRLSDLSLPDPDRLDAQLNELFAPLEQALRRLEGVHVPSGWWRASMESPAPLSIGDTVDELDRSVSEIDWLNAKERSILQDRLREIKAMEGQASELQVDQRHRVGAVLRLFRAIDAVRETEGGRSFARRLGSRFIAAVKSTDAQLLPAATVTELSRVIERIYVYRMHEMEPTLSRNLRRLHVSLTRAYMEAERSLLDQVDELLASSSPRTDPALVAAILDHNETLQSLQVLSSMPGWIEYARTIHPPSAEFLSRQLARLNQDLSNPIRRRESLPALLNLGDRIMEFQQLPLEGQLRQGDPELDHLLSGQAQILADAIDSARIQWIRELAEGELDGDGAKMLQRQWRLLAGVKQALELEQGSLSGLNDWAGWYVPAGVLESWQDRIATRLRIAATALIQSEPEMADAHLQRLAIDMSVVLLVQHLLASRPPDAMEQAGLPVPVRLIGQLVHEPEDDSWMIQQRAVLAEISHYVLERMAARHDGRIEEADEIEKWLSDRSHALHQQLGDGTHSFPDHPDFDTPIQTAP